MTPAAPSMPDIRHGFNRRLMLLRPAILVAIALLLAAPLAHANDLMRLYHEALGQDQTLAAAKHARDAAVEAKPQAWAGVLPQLSASGSLQRHETEYLSRPTGSFLTAGTRNYATNKSWSLTFDDTIFSFAAFRKISQANVQVAAAENTFVNARQSLILRVAQGYFNALAAKDTVRADIAARDAFKAELDEAKARFKVGLSTITDVQQAQASYDSSRATLIGDRRALANQRQALAVIVGHDVAELEPLVPDMPLLKPTPASIAAWLKTASEDNLDLRDAQLQWQIAKRDIGIERAQRYPTLDVQGSVGDSSTGGQLGSHQREYAIGLALKLPLFGGGLIRSQVRQATATAAQQHAQYRLAQRTTAQKTRDAFRGVMSGIASVKAFKQAVQSNRTALHSTQMGFRVGTQTETDVLTAMQNLYTALKSYYQARYDYLDAVLTLKQASGHLVVADLAHVDALLDTDTTDAPPQFPTLPQAAAPQPDAAGR